MKQVFLKSGQAVVENVPSPQIDKGNILVRVDRSCISVGTEVSSLKLSGLSIYRRALKQPENVSRVLSMISEQGLKKTIDRVNGHLSSGSPTGYSASGTVIALGDEVDYFSIGDRVACAGAGFANHAEEISVPVNLAVKVPDGLSQEDASTVTLGSIAMQGVRRLNPAVCETIVVVGLGILGQITSQILKANGCSVIVVDTDYSRCLLAKDIGANVAIDLSSENYIDTVIRHTSGFGADGVIITAASPSDQIISDAMNACRKKGRIVIVGDIGLNLKRSDFYQKELDVLISSSYGPGRYDPVYEEGGHDYPLPYVRWTENRNMESYLDLLASKKIDLRKLSRKIYDLEEAFDAYNSLNSDGVKPLLVLLKYDGQVVDQPDNKIFLDHAVPHRISASQQKQINIALVGASSFVQSVHLPNILKFKNEFNLYAAMSRTGANAKAVARQYSMNYCTTSYEDVLSDNNVDLVLISTRHNLHARQVLQALQAGKHVFVEKPLGLTIKEINDIESFYMQSNIKDVPMLLTGFNRRFAPAVQIIKESIVGRTTPIMIDYQLNAGFIPSSHWVHGPEGGGRNLGEACHIYDLFLYLTGAEAVDYISACSITPSSKQWKSNDNFSATIKFSDGSVCTLVYTALGSKAYSKERMNVYVDGKVFYMDDYKLLSNYGFKANRWSSKSPQKGHYEELKALSNSFTEASNWPISLKSQILASRIALEVESQLTGNSTVESN